MIGGPGNTMFSSYSAAMFICGGSGITFGLSATQDVMRDAFDRRSRLRLVDLVWTVQDPCEFIRKPADQAPSRY
jgi:ferric-chelate reductase